MDYFKQFSSRRRAAQYTLARVQGLSRDDRRWLIDWWLSWGPVSDDEGMALVILADILAAAKGQARVERRFKQKGAK